MYITSEKRMYLETFDHNIEGLYSKIIPLVKGFLSEGSIQHRDREELFYILDWFLCLMDEPFSLKERKAFFASSKGSIPESDFSLLRKILREWVMHFGLKHEEYYLEEIRRDLPIVSQILTYGDQINFSDREMEEKGKSIEVDYVGGLTYVEFEKKFHKDFKTFLLKDSPYYNAKRLNHYLLEGAYVAYRKKNEKEIRDEK